MMSVQERTYLGVPVYKPKVAFFDFSSCEGCQLQVLNNEANLIPFLNLVEVVNFREVMTGGVNTYDIAFIEGSITRYDEVTRLQEIRTRAKVLVAFGSCACFGGVNRLKNRFGDLGWVKREVYGDHTIETDKVRSVDEVVPVNLRIYGCPVKKEELEKIVLDIALGRTVEVPRYPVCMECKGNENVCMFDLGEPCLGPVTRAGCDSWCPTNRMGCWGCRGPADDVNMDEMKKVMKEYGISKERMLDRLECFGGFQKYVRSIKCSQGTGVNP